MKHVWKFDDTDVVRVKALIERLSRCGLVIVRQRRNLSPNRPSISRQEFWLKLVASLLTTQQRSGPTSPISKLLETDPFPLGADACDCCVDLSEYAKDVLPKHGGIRFTERLPKFIALNLPMATGAEWEEVSQHLERLRSHDDIAVERAVANFVDDRFWGFGPKQSRNLLQMLGLTRYVVPIDSRVLKWMNEIGFPVPASPGLLAYRDYFEFVEEGLNELCRLAGIYPCILDAAVFGSFDGEDGRDWTEQNATW